MICEHLAKETAAPARARLAMSRLDGDVSVRCLEDARLLVSELVTNAVRHAGGSGPIELRVERRDECIHVEVLDHGDGFAPRERTSEDPLDSGWGMHLVRVVSDRWGITRNGHACVWFELAA